MIKYLIMDVDGTLTDGKIYMGENGEVMKAFSVKDGYVFNYILKPAGIIPIVITARNSKIVQNRCNELGIKEVHQGKLEKLKTLKEIVGKENLSTCVYFGDDILDLKCMIPIKEAGGIVGCPADAVQEVKAVADYICMNVAGNGALREFVEWIVEPRRYEDEIKKRVEWAVTYLKSLKVTEADVGKHIVDDDFFYIVQEYTTKPAEECKLESHRKYIDVQFIVEGREEMDIVDVARLSIKEEYNDEKDVIFWNVPCRMVHLTLNVDNYVVLYPENAHRGAIAVKNNEKVLKIVGKVKCL